MKTGKKLFGIIAALLIGAFLLWDGIKDFRNSRRLKADHKTAVGKVIDERTVYSRKGRTRYYLTVQFQTEQNQSVTREVRVDSDVHRAGASSGSANVYYLPSDPQICQAGNEIETEWTNMAIGSLILFAELSASFIS